MADIRCIVVLASIYCGAFCPRNPRNSGPFSTRMESDNWSDIQQDAAQVTLPPVQFVHISDCYSSHRDLQIVIEFSKEFVATVDDWVGLFPLGWRSLKHYVAYQWIQHQAIDGRQTISISQSKLPTDLQQYYQCIYVNGNTTVVGISKPFYFTDDPLFMEAKGTEELDKELRNREANKQQCTLPTESNMAIDMIPEESLTSINEEVNNVITQCVPTQSLPMQSLPLQSLPMQSLPMQSLVMQSLPMQSLPMQSLPMQSLPMQSLPMQSLPMQSLPMQSLPMQSLPMQSLPMQSLPMQSLPMQSLSMQSCGDNTEFVDSNLETMALVPWTRQDELIWDENAVQLAMATDEVGRDSESDRKSSTVRKQRKDKVEINRTEAIPLDEKGRAHTSSISLLSCNLKPDKLSPRTDGVASSRTSCESLEPGSPEKCPKKDANLDQVVSRFFNFLGSVIAKSESDKSLEGEKTLTCSRCSQLELELESAKSRAFHAEYREGALVRELLSLRKQVKQQEMRTSELLDHLHGRCDDSSNVEILKDQMSQVLNELQQAAHNIHRLTQEKNILEKNVGNLMWEKAGLCAKLQVLQQGEARNTRRTTELSSALINAQEEMHHLSRRHGESQQFVEALLATISNLGFTNIKDPSGSSISLENIAGPGLHLEASLDENALTTWTNKPKFQQPDKWYKAILTSREIIQQLQTKIHDLERFCLEQDTGSNRVLDLQTCLNEERKKSKHLENQMGQMMMSYTSTQDGQSAISPVFALQDRITNQSSRDLDLCSPGYELQGARPKFASRQQLCEPVDELDRETQAAPAPSTAPAVSTYRAFNIAAPIIDNFPQNCPYCGEVFPAYLLPNDKQEHIRMHMYSELQRTVSNNVKNQ